MSLAPLVLNRLDGVDRDAMVEARVARFRTLCARSSHHPATAVALALAPCDRVRSFPSCGPACPKALYSFLGAGGRRVPHN
jgi:hypothetical protein